MTDFLRKTIIGAEFINYQGLRFIVKESTDIKRRRYRIKFINTGFETETGQCSIYKGNVKDRYHKDICNVASTGNASCTKYPKEYSIWHGMIQRCYDKNCVAYPNYGGKGVTVCDKWLCFEYFIDDLPLIDGYDKEKFYRGKIHLDKDLKQQNKDKSSMFYSLETCTFISQQENNEIHNKKRQKIFEAVSPNGSVYIEMNVNKFAREHELDTKYIYRCFNGQIKKYKGWSFSRC